MGNLDYINNNNGITEATVRRIVQEELRRNTNGGRFGLNTIPFHTHDGVNSQKIKEENIIPGASVYGDVTFSSVDTYKINLNSSFTPSSIFVYGLTTGDYSGAAQRSIFFGSATVTPTLYLQSATTRSAVTGNLQFPLNGKPAQSGVYFSSNRGSTSFTYAGVTEDHVVSVAFPDPTSIADIRARLTITEVTRDYITVDIPYLDSGWSIIASFVIS